MGLTDNQEADVVVGYLVTLPDGFECRLGPDLTRAQNYAVQQRALRIEAMVVRRKITSGDGSAHASDSRCAPPQPELKA